MPAIKSAVVSFRVSPAFREALRLAAVREHRTQTNMVEYLLYEHCRVRGIPIRQSSTAERIAATVRRKAKATRSKRKRS